MIKQFLIKLFKINVYPVYTINVLDFNNLEYAPRASGRTTRLADMYIQLLFSTGRIRIADHHSTERMNYYLADIILRRLRMEHPHLNLDIKGNIIAIREFN